MIHPFRCLSQECRESGNAHRILYFQKNVGRYEACPRCGQRGNIHQLEPVHLIQEDPRGQIQGSEWAGKAGQRFEFLCATSKRGYAKGDGPEYPKSFTGDPEAATCTECLLAFGKKLINAELVY